MFENFPNIFKEDVEDYRQVFEKSNPGWEVTIGGT
jgi:hypothetical protein